MAYRVSSDLKSAVSDQGSLTNKFVGQSSKLNSLAGNYNTTAKSLTDTAVSNMLKYGEVSENDLVGQATTDNTLAYGKAYDTARRNMTRMGINPNSGRFAGMDQSFALNRAAAEAGARNLARIQARNENFSRAGALAGLGYKYSALGLNSINSSTNALNAAAANQDRYITSTGNLSFMSDRAKAANAILNPPPKQTEATWTPGGLSGAQEYQAYLKNLGISDDGSLTTYSK